MDAVNEFLKWISIGAVGWYLSGMSAGLIAVFVDWLRRPPDPTENEIRYAAEQYQLYYGTEVHSVIGEHMFAATFVPDGRHRQFLKRVSVVLESPPVGSCTHDPERLCR